MPPGPFVVNLDIFKHRRRLSETTNFQLCLDTGRLDLETAAGMIPTLVEKTR